MLLTSALAPPPPPPPAALTLLASITSPTAESNTGRGTGGLSASSRVASSNEPPGKEYLCFVCVGRRKQARGKSGHCYEGRQHRHQSVQLEPSHRSQKCQTKFKVSKQQQQKQRKKRATTCCYFVFSSFWCNTQLFYITNLHHPFTSPHVTRANINKAYHTDK